MMFGILAEYCANAVLQAVLRQFPGLDQLLSAGAESSAFLWSKATFLLRVRRRRSSLCRSVPAIVLRFSRFNWG